MDLASRKFSTFKKTATTAAPFTASAALLSVIHPPVEWSFLAWVALVPFVLACSPDTKPKTLALTAYVVSACYWLFNLHWVAPITVIGWLAFCLYTALLWPIAALALRYCRTKGIPLFLAAGVVFVGAERLQGFLLGGFFWRLLAHSQYNNITLIQICDIFGAAGLSLLIAMVNGLLAELIIAARSKSVFAAGNLTKTLVVCAAVIAAVAYGRWRISQEPQCVEHGPLVAALQSNVPQSVKRTFRAETDLFNDCMAQSKAAAATGAQLIVWPETMVQAILDTEVWPFLVRAEDVNESTIFDNALREHANATAYLLVGSYGADIEYDRSAELSLLRYNSAFLYRPDGQQDPRRYDKIHLVMFGEYLPFRKSIYWLYSLLMKFTPYNYDYSLDAGSKYTVFDMTAPISQAVPAPARTYRFGVIICYEDTVPQIARRFALDRQGRKQVDWLVNISNDGWFVRFEDNNQKVTASAELAQHAAICAFRAVENRLPIIRSTNTGISCLIDSMGRIHDGYMHSSNGFPNNTMNRTGIAGWFADRMPIDNRTTFFSKHGRWLDNCCGVSLALLSLVPFSAKLPRTRKVTDYSGRTND